MARSARFAMIEEGRPPRWQALIKLESCDGRSVFPEFAKPLYLSQPQVIRLADGAMIRLTDSGAYALRSTTLRRLTLPDKSTLYFNARAVAEGGESKILACLDTAKAGNFVLRRQPRKMVPKAEREGLAARVCGTSVRPKCILVTEDNVYTQFPAMPSDASEMRARLSQLRESEPRQHQDIVLWVIRDTLWQLRELHATGLVHRDVKPDNVLVGQKLDRQPGGVLNDFGLVVEIDNLPKQNAAGTYEFMAPELHGGNHRITEKIDVWSAGVTLWALLTGTRGPFHASTLRGLVTRQAVWSAEMQQIAVDPMNRFIQDDLRQQMDELPKNPDLRQLIKLLLHPNPDERISAAEAIAFIDKFLPFEDPDSIKSFLRGDKVLGDRIAAALDDVRKIYAQGPVWICTDKS